MSQFSVLDSVMGLKNVWVASDSYKKGSMRRMFIHLLTFPSYILTATFVNKSIIVWSTFLGVSSVSIMPLIFTNIWSPTA